MPNANSYSVGTTMAAVVPADSQPEAVSIGRKAQKKIYPQPQRSGKLIFFIPWTWHGVDPVNSQEERIVVAGNVMRLK